MSHLCYSKQGSKSSAKRERCLRNVRTGYRGLARQCNREVRAAPFPKFVKYSDVIYIIPADTPVDAAREPMERFTPAWLSDVAEPDEVLDGCGPPIRKATA